LTRSNESSIAHGADVTKAAAAAVAEFNLTFSFLNGAAPHTNSPADVM